MIDAQVHLLDPARFPYPEPTQGHRPSAEETATVGDLLAVLDAHGVDRAVLVQASVYGFDNRAILDALARAPERFRAVVMAPNDPIVLQQLGQTPGVCGVRLNLTHFAGHGDHRQVVETARMAADAGLCVQLQADPERLLTTIDALGDMPVIIDHLGRPDPAEDSGDLERLAALAGRRQTWLKVSGGFRLDMPGDWRKNTERLRRLTNAFGAEQLLWGSDWPFINIKGKRPRYKETLDWGRALITDMAASQAAAARLFGWAP